MMTVNDFVSAEHDQGIALCIKRVVHDVCAVCVYQQLVMLQLAKQGPIFPVYNHRYYVVSMV